MTEEHLDDEISLLDLVLVLARHSRMIFLIPFLTGVIVVGYLLIAKILPPDQSPMPDVFTADASLLWETTQSSAMSAIPSQLANLAGISTSARSSDRDLIIEFLKSRAGLDLLIEELNLTHEYETRREARRAISNAMKVDIDSSTGIVELSFTHTDPIRATEMVEASIEVIRRFSRQNRSTENSQRQAQLSEQLRMVGNRIEELETNIKDFQRRHGFISAEAVAQEQTATIGDLRSRILLADMQIEAYSDFFMPDDPTVRRLVAERRSYQQLLEDIESGRVQLIGNLPAEEARMDVPQLIFDFQRMSRELEVFTNINIRLRQELETLILSGDFLQDSFQVLVPPEVPEEKSGPSRAVTAVVSVFAAFFVSVFAAFVKEYTTRVGDDPSERSKVAEIKYSIRLILPFSRRERKQEHDVG